jgi:hypothetical protein
MLTPPPGQELYPYHDSPSRLRIYAANGSRVLLGRRARWSEVSVMMFG